jgi:hypothetical protein
MFDIRFRQVGDLLYVLFHPVNLLWPTDPHNARYVPYSTVLHKATYSLLALPESNT